MASTTASAASLMDTSSSSPTVGNHGPAVSQASLSRPLGACLLLLLRVDTGLARLGKAAAECPPERMMGSTSLYSRRTQMKSRARSWRSKGQVKSTGEHQTPLVGRLDRCFCSLGSTARAHPDGGPSFRAHFLLLSQSCTLGALAKFRDCFPGLRLPRCFIGKAVLALPSPPPPNIPGSR